MSSIKCPECSLTNWSTAMSCKRCGYMFQSMENSSSTESEDLRNQFDDYQTHAMADFQAPSNKYQQNWEQKKPYWQDQQHGGNKSSYNGSKQKTGLAVASLVMGVIGCFVTAPIGLVLGIVSLVKTNRYPNEYGGKGMAIAGVILNSIGLISIPIIAAIAIPNLLAARRSANEGAAIYSLRRIAEAENTYMSTIGTRNCADFSQLAKNNMIDPVLASGTKSGYRYVLTATPGGCEIYATPTVSKGVSSTGIRSFFISSDEGWIIRAGNKNGLMADKSDMPINTGTMPKQTNQPSKIATQKSPTF